VVLYRWAACWLGDGAEVGEKLVKMRWYLRGVLIVAIRYLSLSDACV